MQELAAEMNQAIQLRKEGKSEEALVILKGLVEQKPNDPTLNYQAAWTCDGLGREGEAAPFYVRALENGLAGEERLGAYTGLGSTYRCLGRYEESLELLDKAIKEFPEANALKSFRALTLYNLNRPEESIEVLLNLLVDTTSDEEIQAYGPALKFYSDKLKQTWD